MKAKTKVGVWKYQLLSLHMVDKINAAQASAWRKEIFIIKFIMQGKTD